MLENENGLKTVVRIMCIIVLVLITAVMFMALKWFANFLEIKSINEIWPEGETIIYQFLLVFFAIAAIVFFVRMMCIDFERQVLKDKLKHCGTADKVEHVREKKAPKKVVKAQPNPPVIDNSELERVRAELAKERSWHEAASLMYPSLDTDVKEFMENSPIA